MAEQLIRNEQVVSSILTTSSIPQSLTYQGVAAFLRLNKNRPEITPKTGLCPFLCPVIFCVPENVRIALKRLHGTDLLFLRFQSAV